MVHGKREAESIPAIDGNLTVLEVKLFTQLRIRSQLSVVCNFHNYSRRSISRQESSIAFLLYRRYKNRLVNIGPRRIF